MYNHLQKYRATSAKRPEKTKTEILADYCIGLCLVLHPLILLQFNGSMKR